MSNLRKSETQIISIGLEKLGDKRYGESVKEELIDNLTKNITLSNLKTYVDTAEIYGLNQSEIIIGKIARRIGRHKIHISTKVGLSYKKSKNKVETYRYFDDESIVEAINNCCKRLTYSPDRIYLHWPHHSDNEITFNCLNKIISSAKDHHINEIGICNISSGLNNILLEELKDIGVNILQERINILARKKKFIEAAKALDFKLVSHSSLAQGLLSSSSRSVLIDSKNENFPKYLSNNEEEEYQWVANINHYIKSIANELNCTFEEIVIGCQKQLLGGNSEIIVGVKSKKHIDSIFRLLQNTNISLRKTNEILNRLNQYQYEPRSPNHQ